MISERDLNVCCYQLTILTSLNHSHNNKLVLCLYLTVLLYSFDLLCSYTRGKYLLNISKFLFSRKDLFSKVSL